MKLDPLLMCYMFYFLGCSSLKRCSLITAPIFSSPSTTRLFCRTPPSSYSYSFAADTTRRQRCDRVLNLNQRKDPAGTLHVVFSPSYLNSWTHRGRGKQINGVGQKMKCESWIREKRMWKNELSWWCLEYDGCPWRHFGNWPFYSALRY